VVAYPVEPKLFGAFVLTGLALNLTPGPDMLFVLASGVRGGRPAGVKAALGISAGSCVHAAAAASGFSAIVASSSLAFSVVKFLGAAYLVLIGLRALRSSDRSTVESISPLASDGSVFVRAVAVNVLNPKVALFFLALVPHFVNVERGHVALQFLLLGLAFNVTGTMVNATVGLFAGEIRRRLAEGGSWRRITSRMTGWILVALGLRLALSGER
jgi:threonine/homoserine/homoserine lactone efflux protein